jgi:hypothetical protein
MFSSFGVWLILSSPMNSREPSESSVLKTLTVPLGRGIPSLFLIEFVISTLLLAFSEVSA